MFYLSLHGYKMLIGPAIDRLLEQGICLIAILMSFVSTNAKCGREYTKKSRERLDILNH